MYLFTFVELIRESVAPWFKFLLELRLYGFWVEERSLLLLEGGYPAGLVLLVVDL